jgi:hypothetical protein
MKLESEPTPKEKKEPGGKRGEKGEGKDDIDPLNPNESDVISTGDIFP